jgi:hypothetical protein
MFFRWAISEGKLRLRERKEEGGRSRQSSSWPQSPIPNLLLDSLLGRKLIVPKRSKIFLCFQKNFKKHFTATSLQLEFIEYLHIAPNSTKSLNVE